MAKNIPLLMLTPETVKMMSEYHTNVGNDEDSFDLARVAIILKTVRMYNDGHMPDETLRANLTDAVRGRNQDVINKMKVLIP